MSRPYPRTDSLLGAPPALRRSDFRPDIEGLRALAVILVVLYHMDLPAFSGGSVGIDVFFVVSGYLITGLLYRELAETGRVRLTRFYARRLRRLLPASALVAFVTLALSRAVLSPFDVVAMQREALATVTYLANVFFAATGTDYLREGAGASPFQHYWSLALEERFYVLWPLFILGTFAMARRFGRGTRLVVIVGIASVVALSLAASIYLTPVRQPWAYFLLPTRAWELAAGGLLALAPSLPRGLGARPRALLGMVGLVCIGMATTTFDASTPFPGWTAGLPVVGTLLLIASGTGTNAVRSALSAQPFQALGRRSYSLYLRHWPLLVLLERAAEEPPSLAAKSFVVAMAVGLSIATYAWVEDPLRHYRVFVQKPYVNYVGGVGLTAASVGMELYTAEARAVTDAGGLYVDTRSIFCNASMCPAVVDDLLVWKDAHHLAADFARLNSDRLGALLPPEIERAAAFSEVGKSTSATFMPMVVAGCCSDLEG